MTTMHAARGEFSHLDAEAAELGVPLQRAERVSLALDDARTLSALRFGDEAPRVVFAHGAGLNAHTWDRTVLALGLPALALDLPGHGDSSWRDDADYDPARLAPDVARAIESWAAEPVALVGHSLGGLTALHVAASRPDLVARIVLVDILPGAGADGSAQLARFYERLDFDSIDDVLDHAGAFGLGGAREKARRSVELNTRTRPDGRVEWKHHMARIMSPLAPDARPAAPDADAARRALEAAAAPIDLVAAEHGFLSRADVDTFRAARPGDAVHPVASSHNVQETAYLELAGLIRPAVPRT